GTLTHLTGFSGAGRIVKTKTGRTVSCQLAAAPMREAVGWLNHYQRFCSERLDRLAAFLEEEVSCPSPPTSSSNPASPSSGVSKPRQKRFTPPGRTPKKS